MKGSSPKSCQRCRFDGSLVRGLRIMLSSPAGVWQKRDSSCGVQRRSINLRGLTGTTVLPFLYSIITGIPGEASTNGVNTKQLIIQQENRSQIEHFMLSDDKKLTCCDMHACKVQHTFFMHFKVVSSRNFEWLQRIWHREKCTNQRSAFYWSVLIIGVSKIYGPGACQKTFILHTELRNLS